MFIYRILAPAVSISKLNYGNVQTRGLHAFYPLVNNRMGGAAGAFYEHSADRFTKAQLSYSFSNNTWIQPFPEDEKGYALNFSNVDGTAQAALKISDVLYSAFDLTGTELTISLDVYRTRTSTTEWLVAVADHTSAGAFASTYQTHIYFDNFGANVLYVQIKNIYDGRLNFGADDIPVNKWTTLTITANSSNVYVYANGRQIASGASLGGTIPAIGSNGYLWFGFHVYSGNHFNGKLRNIRFYKKALSPGQIRDLYNKPNEIFLPQKINITGIQLSENKTPPTETSTYAEQFTIVRTVSESVTSSETQQPVYSFFETTSSLDYAYADRDKLTVVNRIFEVLLHLDSFPSENWVNDGTNTDPIVRNLFTYTQDTTNKVFGTSAIRQLGFSGDLRGAAANHDTTYNFSNEDFTFRFRYCPSAASNSLERGTSNIILGNWGHEGIIPPYENWYADTFVVECNYVTGNTYNMVVTLYTTSYSWTVSHQFTHIANYTTPNYTFYAFSVERFFNNGVDTLYLYKDGQIVDSQVIPTYSGIRRYVDTNLLDTIWVYLKRKTNYCKALLDEVLLLLGTSMAEGQNYVVETEPAVNKKYIYYENNVLVLESFKLDKPTYALESFSYKENVYLNGEYYKGIESVSLRRDNSHYVQDFSYSSESVTRPTANATEIIVSLENIYVAQLSATTESVTGIDSIEVQKFNGLQLPVTYKILLTSTREKDYRVLRAQYGDGYEQVAADGINNIVESWTINWGGLTAAERNEVWSVLDEAAGWRTLAYVPCDEEEVKYFRTIEKATETRTGKTYNITVRLKQVFVLFL